MCSATTVPGSTMPSCSSRRTSTRWPTSPRPRSERRFDLALCLEVAHILDEEVGPQLVDSLLARRLVLFGAAIPGQGGSTLNEQWPRYWAELFARRGYVATDPFRAALWEHPDVKWWFAQNTVYFATPDALARMPVLAAARCSDAPLPLVHPGCCSATPTRSRLLRLRVRSRPRRSEPLAPSSRRLTRLRRHGECRPPPQQLMRPARFERATSASAGQRSIP